MRRLLTWLLVTLGIAALVRKLRRGSATAVPTLPPPPAEPIGTDDPADELRRKLAESRDEPGRAAPEAPVDQRRGEVHAEGRAALEEMRSSSDG